MYFANLIPYMKQLLPGLIGKWLLVSLIALSGFTVSAQPLSGMYTIGGISPNYTSFTAAVNDMELRGISGHVLFNVRKGTYESNINISQITGSGSNATIEFRSETGIPSDVILRHSHFSSSGNYTIYLNGTDYITFRNMTITAYFVDPTPSPYNRVVYITNNSNNVRFIGNEINSWFLTTQLNSNNDCIAVGPENNNTTSNDNDTILFYGNTIRGGARGISMAGYRFVTNQTSNWKIEKNIFIDQTGTGVYIKNCSTPKIIDNKMIQGKSSKAYVGITVTVASDSLNISGNHISTYESSTGINLNQIVSGSASFLQVCNNMIAMEHSLSSSVSYGIRASTCSLLTIAYNSISIHSLNNTGYVVWAETGCNMRLQNNILAHYGLGRCYYVTNGTNQFSSNYNVLYNSNGTALAEINGVQHLSLSSLASAGREQNSVYANPLFVRKTNLIPTNALVYNIGFPVGGISKDYFGNPRSTTTPDPGAFEGSLPTTDAGISRYDAIPSLICPNESIPMYVYVKNFSVDTVKSFEIQYSVNGVLQTTINRQDTLLASQETGPILVGQLNAATFDELLVRIWTKNPNGSGDLFPYNDTISFSVMSAMIGDYTIGATSSDFTSITSAVAMLSKQGVCGPVTFNIKPGIYTEQVKIPAINGASQSNLITIKSQTNDSTSVILKYTGNLFSNFLIALEGAKFIHIKNLGFEPTSNIYSKALVLRNAASNNLISGNYFKGKVATSNSPDETSLSIAGGNTNQNIILANRFENGDVQLSLISLVSNTSTDNQIRKNIFEGTSAIAIDVSNQKKMLICDNIIRGTRVEYHSVIQISSVSDMSVVERNTISVSGAEPSGLKLSYITGTQATPIVIRNNFISVGTNYNGKCLEIQNCQHLKMLNNSLNLINDGTVFTAIGNISNVEMLNNIFQAEGVGKLSFVTNDLLDSLKVRMNYNCYYKVAADPFLDAGIPITFSEWKSRIPQDKNSVFTKPRFISATDLHVYNALMLKDRGTPTSYVTDDIDGEARPAGNPDIGADDFTIDYSTVLDLKAESVMISSPCLRTDSLRIRIINKSIIPINTYKVNWGFFGQLNKTFIGNKPIPAGDTLLVNIGQISVSNNTFYKLDFDVVLPNGQEDNYIDDNIVSAELAQTPTVKIFTRRGECNGDTELYVHDYPDFSVLWSNGSTGKNIVVSTPGTYSVTIIGKDGCQLSDTITIQ